jgi:hypothetical protein
MRVVESSGAGTAAQPVSGQAGQNRTLLTRRSAAHVQRADQRQHVPVHAAQSDESVTVLRR